MSASWNCSPATAARRSTQRSPRARWHSDAIDGTNVPLVMRGGVRFLTCELRLVVRPGQTIPGYDTWLLRKNALTETPRGVIRVAITLRRDILSDPLRPTTSTAVPPNWRTPSSRRRVSSNGCHLQTGPPHVRPPLPPPGARPAPPPRRGAPPDHRRRRGRGLRRR